MPLNHVEEEIRRAMAEAASLWSSYSATNLGWQGQFDAWTGYVLANGWVGEDQVAELQKKSTLTIKEYEQAEAVDKEGIFLGMCLAEMYIILQRGRMGQSPYVAV